MSRFSLGLDLDNTIIDYNQAFADVAVELGLLPRGHGLTLKDHVKSRLCAQADGEARWMELQGQVYGRQIERARLFDGVADCIRAVRQKGGRVSIVSHKTQYGHFDPRRVNLWDAAVSWMERRAFFSADGFGIARQDVHFSETRESKIANIAAIGCHAFVDDLPEVLLHPHFPPNTRRIWFAADKNVTDAGGLAPHRDWAAIGRGIHAIRPTG